MKKVYGVILTILFIAGITYAFMFTNTQHESTISTNSQKQELYVCPMHPDVQSHTKDNCPICGMFLVKVENNTETTKKIASTNSQKQELYVCPMHPDVQSHTKDNCPICGMFLVKVENNTETTKKIASTNSQKQELYVCPMHPDVQSHTKDNCPICGMFLVKVENNTETTTDAVATVTLRPAQLQHLQAQTHPATKKKLYKELRTLARVISSERQESNIPSRIAGRIEKVYHTTTGALIRKGDKLVDIYSPELITAGEEYLALQKELHSNKNISFQALAKEAKDKLLLFGVTEEQIAQWEKLNSVPKSITLYAPFSGSVITRYAVAGKYVQRGANLYDVLNLSSVWVQMAIYEKDIALINNKQKVQFSFIPYPGEEWNSTIDFISPIVNKESQTLEARATLHNSGGKLKPNITGEAYIQIPLETTLVVPSKALIRTGKETLLWVQKNPSTFIAKVVQVGHEAKGYTQILSGLTEGEPVVVHGSFLLDAQAQLFGGYTIK